MAKKSKNNEGNWWSFAEKVVAEIWHRKEKWIGSDRVYIYEFALMIVGRK